MTTTVVDLLVVAVATALVAMAVIVTTIVRAARAGTMTTIVVEDTGRLSLVDPWTTILLLAVAMMNRTAGTTQPIRIPLMAGLRMIGHLLLATSLPVMVPILLETMGILLATVHTSVVVATDHETSYAQRQYIRRY
jgi:hypothetical protein